MVSFGYKFFPSLSKFALISPNYRNTRNFNEIPGSFFVLLPKHKSNERNLFRSQKNEDKETLHWIDETTKRNWRQILPRK